MKSQVRPLQRLAGLAWTAAAALAGTAAHADEDPSVTPYRPSVSTPAALSAPGWLEVEAGALRSRADDPARSDSLPYTFKLAFTPDWGIRVGGDAWRRQVGTDGTTLQGQGDTGVVLKRRFAVDEAQAFGLELGVQWPTARHGLGSGHAATGLNGIYSADFGGAWHTDLNLTATRLGGADPGLGRTQLGWAAALSRALNERWGLGAEFSGTRQAGGAPTRQALVAASYAPAHRLALDFGFSKGLTAASGGWSSFAGITFLALQLF